MHIQTGACEQNSKLSLNQVHDMLDKLLVSFNVIYSFEASF